MKNKFALVFGISIIVVGIASIWIEIDQTTIIVISFVSFLFMLIDQFLGSSSYLNIIPLCLLFIFLVFPNYMDNTIIMKVLSNDNINNCLMFLSFGSLFIFSYIQQHFILKVEELKNQTELLEAQTFILKQATQDAEDYSCLLVILILIKEKINAKDTFNYSDISAELELLEKYFKDKHFLNQLKTSILNEPGDNISLIEAMEKEYKKKTPIINRKDLMKTGKIILDGEKKEKTSNDKRKNKK